MNILMLKPSCSVRTERHDEAMSGFSQFHEKQLKRDEENKTSFHNSLHEKRRLWIKFWVEKLKL